MNIQHPIIIIGKKVLICTSGRDLIYKVQQTTNYAILAGTAILAILVTGAILLITGSNLQNAAAQQTGVMIMDNKTGMIKNKSDIHDSNNGS